MNRSPNQTTLRLITIPISHYCEKARWALTWAGLPYREEAHLQLFHYGATLRAGGGRTVPVLIHPGGALSDSTAILRWVDRESRCGSAVVDQQRGGLYPADPAERAEVERWVALFDEELGPSGRLWMYHHLLDRPELALKYACTGVPAWQRRLLPAAFPLVRRFLQRLLQVSPATAAAAQRRFQQVLEQVAAHIADGRTCLVGARFSAADLTFAALCAPLLMPPEYGVPLPQPDELPAPCAAVISACRAHPAGRFALEQYRRHRAPVPDSALNLAHRGQLR